MTSAIVAIMQHARRLTRAALLLAVLAPPAAAQSIPGLDPPVKIIKLPLTTTPPSGDAIDCIYYADLMIRIFGTDTPWPDNAQILKPAPCSRGQPSGGMELPSSGSFFSGRLGNFLLFQLADPNGASNFTIFDAANGRTLFTDGQMQIIAAALANGALRLRYIRGVNATCSLLSDRYGCWSKLQSAGQIPRGAFPGPPSAATCRKGYERDWPGMGAAVPDDDPSLISYPAALTLDRSGAANVRVLGALRCDPMP